jgi:hypothetical protein
LKIDAWLALACVVCSFPTRAETLSARLTMVPIDMLTRAAISGFGAATGELDGRLLRIEGSFAGMQGVATAARIHEGALTGVRGPAIIELEFDPARQGSFGAEIELSGAQAASLRAGRWYIQIHSAAAPDGNLWGWLLP